MAQPDERENVEGATFHLDNVLDLCGVEGEDDIDDAARELSALFGGEVERAEEFLHATLSVRDGLRRALAKARTESDVVVQEIYRAQAQQREDNTMSSTLEDHIRRMAQNQPKMDELRNPIDMETALAQWILAEDARVAKDGGSRNSEYDVVRAAQRICALSASRGQRYAHLVARAADIPSLARLILEERGGW